MNESILSPDAPNAIDRRTLLQRAGIGAAVTTSQQIAAARNALNAGMAPTIAD